MSQQLKAQYFLVFLHTFKTFCFAIKLLVFLFLFCLSVFIEKGYGEKLIDYVDPFIGTGGDGFGVGSTYPGPSTPFGMIKPGPDTSRGDSAPGFAHCSGYWYKDTHIRGFSHTRMHGTGVPDYGNIMIMPAIGQPDVMMEEKNYRSRFNHKEEEARVGYYAVTLQDTGIRVEITAGNYVAYHRYKFSIADNALIVINASHFIGEGKAVKTDVYIKPEKSEISGAFHYNGPMSARNGGVKTYFVIKTKFPFTSYGVWQNDKYSDTGFEAHGTKTGAVLGFQKIYDEIIDVKVAISFISIEQARANMEAEHPGWDFVSLRSNTEQKWGKLLSRIRIEGGTEKQRRILYTAFYHSLLMPTLFSEANGQYMGFDRKIHKTDKFRYYTDFSLWDTFRTLHPLLTLIAPDYQRDMIISLLKMYEQSGYIPKWPLGTGDTNCMIGTPADIVITDSYLKGIKNFDIELSYKGLRDTAMHPTSSGAPSDGRGGIDDYIKLGYVPADKYGSAVSMTLEYAFADYALSRLSAALGKKEDAKMFFERSKNYRNVWNTEIGFFDGRNTDGTFIKPFNDTGWRDFYTEGNAWQWLWFVPHDVDGLIELFGSKEKFLKKLDEFFSKSHKAPNTLMSDIWYWHGNEPDIYAAYLYLWADRPDRTQEEVRWIMNTKYSDKPSGLDGNDDGGTLSAWYIFSAMGLFSIPATTQYLIGSPIFDKITLDLNNGKQFIVKALDTSEKNLYVQEATLNGKSLKQFYLDHQTLMNGGTLEVKMGEKPGSYGVR